MGRTRKPYRDGFVHVKENLCATCIFRPGNLMHLEKGRVKQLVKQATKAQSCIPCHETLDGKQAVCRGFFEKHATAPLETIITSLNWIGRDSKSGGKNG